MSGSSTSLTAEPEIEAERILHFADGIPGFPRSRRFVLVHMGQSEDQGGGSDSAFQLLQSLDEPDVSIIVTVPWLFFPDYDFELSELEQAELAITAVEETVVFAPVTLDAEQQRIYLNLLGPIVINSATRQGRQVVLVDTDLPVRAAVELG
jgi:flagellar assembly factor FliW